MVSLPRLMIAAPATGQGKTTVATGLMAALRSDAGSAGSAGGRMVSGHKVGPDYIDPGYHALATARPGRNLDPHLVGPERIVPLLLHGATAVPIPGSASASAPSSALPSSSAPLASSAPRATSLLASPSIAGASPSAPPIAVIEGVMGLYDGKVGTDGFASSAHVAALTSTPVVLVMDVARQSRSVAAIAAGLAAFDNRVSDGRASGSGAFDSRVHIAGVILNRAGSPRNVAEISGAMEGVGLPVLGVLPHDEQLAVPSRHLGLVPAAERDASEAMVARLGEQVARHLDLSALLDVAATAPDLDAEPWDPHAEMWTGSRERPGSPGWPGSPGRPGSGDGERPVIAVAGGRAFTFRYAETTELLHAAGCEVVPFDPLTDTALPSGTRGIYLGGGFPEIYAADLAANRALLRDLRAAVADGVPTVAECAGLLYLARDLDGTPMAGVVPASAAMTGRLTLRYPSATAPRDSLLTRAGEVVTGHEFHRTHTDPLAGTGTPWPGPGDGGASGARASGDSVARAREPGAGPAWEIDGAPAGFATDTWHASYLHVHWAGHPHLARRFAAAAHAVPPRSPALPPAPAPPPAPPVTPAPQGDEWPIDTPIAVATGHSSDPLRHHGDAETGEGLLDFAVNVYAGARPAWLDRALHEAIDQAASYPDARPAHEAIARCHGRGLDEVLATSGAAEAFTLIARARPWRAPVVVHPQFTEPHAALRQAGYSVTTVMCRAEDGFALDPSAVPGDADLVVIGNPNNPTGVLHPAASIRELLRPGRLVVVDEAFMDAVFTGTDFGDTVIGDAVIGGTVFAGAAPERRTHADRLDRLRAVGLTEEELSDERESLVSDRAEGLLVIRSLTKHWSIPGIRAGYVVGDPAVIAELAALQTPWSVSSPAVAATVACLSGQARAEARERALAIGRWREYLESGLRSRSVEHVPSAASFVLARVGEGTRAALRACGVAVRRCDTFPGLDASWARIAVRPPDLADRLLSALDQLSSPGPEAGPPSPDRAGPPASGQVRLP